MDEIVLADYDPNWPLLYEVEASRLRQVLSPDKLARIEHFGSTAVPGLTSKPIIDILVGVNDLDKANLAAVPTLESLGYSFWYENPDRARMFFVKGLPPNGPRTYHVHMVELENEIWERLLFRDYLRKHQEEVQSYTELKRNLILMFPEEREAYTEGKTAYISHVMQKARIESE